MQHDLQLNVMKFTEKDFYFFFLCILNFEQNYLLLLFKSNKYYVISFSCMYFTYLLIKL